MLRPHALARPPPLCPASHARFGRAALPVPQAPSEAGPHLGIGGRRCAGVRLPFLLSAHLHTHRQSPGSPGLRSPPGPFPAPLCQRPEQLPPLPPPPPCGRESPSHPAPDHHGGGGTLRGGRGLRGRTREGHEGRAARCPLPGDAAHTWLEAAKRSVKSGSHCSPG